MGLRYHIVRIPKCRRKKLYGEVAQYLGEIFHELAGQRESRIVEGHVNAPENKTQKTGEYSPCQNCK
jgi:REP element-mobilizing transposase RayT